LNQPQYVFLDQVLSKLKNIGYFKFKETDDILHPNDAKANSIFIFDDIIIGNQDAVREYFSFGRHSDIDCFYLCQSYAKMPKHLVRDNANFLVVFKQELLNVK